MTPPLIPQQHQMSLGCIGTGPLIRHRHPIHAETEAGRSFPTHIGQVMQNADTRTLCTCKVDDISLSILRHQTITTPGDLGLSCL
jgi:hypothetical protein